MRSLLGLGGAVAALGAVAAFGLACDSGAKSPSGASSTSSGSSGAASSSGSSGSSGGSSGGTPGPGTIHAGCRIFPNDNPWNRDISAEAIDADLTAKVLPKMNLTRGLHADWGKVSDGYGIPITVGKASTPVPITWSTTYGARESDKLPCPTGGGEFCYPIPLDAKIEGGPGADPGSDRHVLFLANDGAPNNCIVYELFGTQNPSGGGFTAGSGAFWKLDSNALRKEGDTSADAAGLSIMAGLVRREEVVRGEITHAIRFTMSKSQNGYIHPATHAAGNADATLPPMGLRVRVKASFSEAGFSGDALVILKAMKKYGLILADNGSDWYITGDSDESWEMDDINQKLGTVKGSDFEIVNTGPIIQQPE